MVGVTNSSKKSKGDARKWVPKWVKNKSRQQHLQHAIVEDVDSTQMPNKGNESMEVLLGPEKLPPSDTSKPTTTQEKTRGAGTLLPWSRSRIKQGRLATTEDEGMTTEDSSAGSTAGGGNAVNPAVSKKIDIDPTAESELDALVSKLTAANLSSSNQSSSQTMTRTSLKKARSLHRSSSRKLRSPTQQLDEKQSGLPRHVRSMGHNDTRSWSQKRVQSKLAKLDEEDAPGVGNKKDSGSVARIPSGGECPGNIIVFVEEAPPARRIPLRTRSEGQGERFQRRGEDEDEEVETTKKQQPRRRRVELSSMPGSVETTYINNNEQESEQGFCDCLCGSAEYERDDYDDYTLTSLGTNSRISSGWRY